MVKYDNFSGWFNEPENYGLRSERFFIQLAYIEDPLERNAFIERWLQAAFDTGYESGLQCK